MKPLVIGIGNPYRGDDGVGWDVAGALDGRHDLDVRQSDGEPMRLLDEWAGRELVVLVDAIRGAEPGGAVLVDRADLVACRPTSSHGGGVAHAIRLAEVLGRLPDRVAVVGVAGADFEAGPQRSRSASAAVDEAVALVERYLATAAGTQRAADAGA